VNAVGAPRKTVPVFVAYAEVAGVTVEIEVGAIGHEALVGRDVLGALVVELDGPRGSLVVRPPAPISRGR
jgi:hypothetical protein